MDTMHKEVFMKSKGSLKVLTVGSIFALLLGLVAVAGALHSTTTVKAANSLNYHGVDHMGSEYSCLSSASTFDGPVDQTAINAMLTWKINIVRIPLNEDCWLGINGEPSGGRSASQYQSDIAGYVQRLNSNGIKAILDLHWTAPGSQKASGQLPMPDADHAPAFWTSVANMFKGNGSVFFDLYNEPYTSSWSCWRNGSSGSNASPCNDVGFAVAGMQTLVNAVRNTGASNVIMLGGLAYANNLTGWLANKPSDPDNNLAASLHIYNFNACNTISCLNSQVAPVAAQVPVIAGEMGENDCAHGFIDTIMPWLDSHSIGYLGWSWSTYGCTTTPSLISNYDGTPTNFGVGLKNHLTSLSGGGGGGNPTPTPTPGGGGGGGTYYKIINRNSGQALDISGASTSNGGMAIQWPYSSGANQQWR
ncbi:MAG: cellulase family glycosylhydrolase, partial [Ktedonobacteraceae bacterium]|nr:cellulase family glycosylhydrolase [Ktedonobacteraceae bacterium]